MGLVRQGLTPVIRLAGLFSTSYLKLTCDHRQVLHHVIQQPTLLCSSSSSSGRTGSSRIRRVHCTMHAQAFAQ